MAYFAYLKASFKRRLHRHLALFIVMTGAFSLPLMISIYRDSSMYGNSAQSFDIRKNQPSYLVVGVKPEDTICFESIEGLETVYDNNVISLTIPAQTADDYNKQKTKYDLLLPGIIEAINDDSIIFTDIGIHGGTTSGNHTGDIWFFAVCMLIFVSFVIFGSAYKNHIEGFSHDVNALLSIGAKDTQITAIFLCEFISLAVVSSLVAIIVSVSVMYSLFVFFLEIRESPMVSWSIFHVDIKNTIICLLVLVAQFYLIQVKITRNKLIRAADSFVRTKADCNILKIRKRVMRIGQNAVSALTRLLSRRTGKNFKDCTLIMFPIVIVMVFIFNYLFIAIDEVTEQPAYEITVSRPMREQSLEAIIGQEMPMDEYGNPDIQQLLFAVQEEFTDEEVSFIKGLRGLSYMNDYPLLPVSQYLTEDSRMKGYALITENEQNYAKTKINAYSGLDEAYKISGFSGETYSVAVNKNHKYLKYEIGDKILLYEYNRQSSRDTVKMGKQGIQHTPPVEVYVTQLLDLPQSKGELEIFANDGLIKILTAGKARVDIGIKLINPKEHKVVYNVLKDRFTGELYKVTDYQESYNALNSITTGLFVLTGFISAVIFVFILIIFFARLSTYIESHSAYIRVLYMQGAKKSAVYRPFIHLSLRHSLMCAGLGVGAGILAIVVFLKLDGQGYCLIINRLSVIVFGVIFTLVLAAYNLPIHLSLTKKIKELY